MLSDTEFKGEGPAPSGSRPPLNIRYPISMSRQYLISDSGIENCYPTTCIQNMASLAVVMFVAMEKNMEKKVTKIS